MVLGYFDGLTSTVSEIVHLTAGDPVEFENVDTSRPHTLSFLNDATPTTANFPPSFDGSFAASPAGTSIGSSTFSTGSLSPGQHSMIYFAAPGLFTAGCAFHYDSNRMRTVIISK
jgi:plastocyanin